MLEKLIQLRNDLQELENRALARMNRKRELGNIEQAFKQEGKFIAYRTAREMLDDEIRKLGGDEPIEEYFDDEVSEVGYNPYTGGYDMDL